MKISKLSVTGLRALSQAEFEFNPGINLLVGVNGVGKTTVLDALRISLSRILPRITSSNSPKLSFELSDISIGSKSLEISCDFESNSISSNLILQKNQEPIIFKERKSESPKYISKRDVFKGTHDIEIMSNSFSSLVQESEKSKIQAVGIYFSTKRSILVDQKVSSTATAGGQSSAFAESLSGNREFNLRIIAQWFKVQEELGVERPFVLKHIAVLKNAIDKFLPEFNNLHVIEIEGVSQLRIDKKGMPFDLRQLSDGERGVLSMVLDIARRLSLANPELSDPLTDGKAIVLIDELDLHLHPKWQRTIVENLTRTFPNCQFIATTHSPQILGEVKPENIIIIEKVIYRPLGSFGIDSSRVLEEILDTLPRNNKVNKIIEELNKSIDENNLKQAKEYLKELKGFLGPNDPDVTRSSTMISFLETDSTDETN